MVHHHQRQQRLGDGRGPDAHAGVVAALGDHLGRLPIHVNRRARAENGAGRLDGDADFEVLAGADAAQHAPGVVAFKALRRQGIAVHGAALGHAGKARANLHAFDGVQAHHGPGDVGIELVIERLAQAHRHAAGHHANARATGVACFAQLVHVGFQGLHIGTGGKERVVGHMVPAFKGNGQFAQLGHATMEAGAKFFAQPFFGDGARGHRGRGQTRRGAATAARVTNAVFLKIGVVGMSWPESLQDVAVIFAALVGVLNQQRNRGARGPALIDARQNLHLVRLLALGHMTAGARAAAVKLRLDVGFRQGHARGAAVDHAANGRAVGFTKVGDCE